MATERKLNISSAKQLRGVSLTGMLSVICAFAVMSAILFPKFATPSSEATLGVIETAATAEMHACFGHLKVKPSTRKSEALTITHVA